LAYLTGTFKTWGLRHDLVIGSTGYRFATWATVVANPLPGTSPLNKTVLCPEGEGAACTYTGTGAPPAGKFDSASIANPLIDVAPANGLPFFTKTMASNGIYVSSILHQQGFSLGDTITLTPHWLLRGAASEDWTWTDNYTLPPSCTAAGCTVLPNPKLNFESHGISSSGSLIFKPRVNMTFYGTYADSLQAPDTPVLSSGTTYVVNSAQALAPYRDQEEEVGYKAVFPRINFSTAMFRIERPYENTNVPPPPGVCPSPLPSPYTTCVINQIVGNQVNYGAEALLEGRVIDSLMIVAGIEVLDPKLTDTHVAATNDKRFVGIPDYKSNILAEYRIPRLTGLYFNFDWQYVGRRPLDDVNQHYTPQYNNFDVGLRYSHKILKNLATWRITATNVTDVHYWSTINPGSLVGLSTSSYLGHLGEPRLIQMSMRYDF
jgi:iron complex outermembrane receptor protein